ncbi:uncharacterized protein YktB (UPF0637 family) [Paenibacillus sp. DS2015]|uniref:YktB family protein n=1 Tax=Paenibacillus sp. DS2015 TaxID=3373917 RepID=UPI003D1D4076
MSFTGFNQQDFDVFQVPGLEQRMEALIANVRPKLELLGTEIAPYLSVLCGEEMYPHVAKHARRTVNPPNDTWVAWAANKRGYKALPHFQVGMFSSHLFIIFAVIYESSNKTIFAKNLEADKNRFKKIIPDQYYWSMDHMEPEGKLNGDTSIEDLQVIATKLATVKKSEILCGLRISNDDSILGNGEQLISLIQSTFENLLPLYKQSFS